MPIFSFKPKMGAYIKKWQTTKIPEHVDAGSDRENTMGGWEF